MGILSLFKKNSSSKSQFDWRNSKAHLLLLSKYLHANSYEYFAQHDYWKAMWDKVLGESAKKAINRFVDEGILIPPEVKDLVSYKYKVTELKDMLRERSLPVSGRKEKLVEMLTQEDPGGMIKLVAGLSLLICSQSGRMIAEQYLEAEKEKRAKVENQVMKYLSTRMFREISQIIFEYETEQVFPSGFGVGLETEKESRSSEQDIAMLTSIFQSKPKILTKLENGTLEAIRIAAAMTMLFGEPRAKKYLPDDLNTGLPYDSETVVRMFRFYISNEGHLARYRKSKLQYIKVLPSPDSCESCKKLEGIRYPLDKVPELPNENCTHEMGCRCTYIPVVDSLSSE
ncbi:MAG: hypothetical protein A2158_00255 [Chloroflexi bacterium RBG_13_46_14]|nr:MAG: hypothetical protein A2158_00255 [Chloroflexi bacterium RBG_13_46_14]